MKKLFPIFLLMLIAHFKNFSQEVSIQVNGSYELAYVLKNIKNNYVINFNENFMPSKSFIFKRPQNYNEYVSRGVKTFKIWSRIDSTLMFHLDFDSFGNIVQEGNILKKYFRTHKSFYLPDSCKVTITSYFENDKIVKLDSSSYNNVLYINKDTNIRKITTHDFVFKSGKLLNEEHGYYNQKYYNKRIENRNDIHKKVGEKKRFTYHSSFIYLRKKLKTNYKDEKIYLISTKTRILYEYYRGSSFIKHTTIKDNFIWHLNERNFNEPTFNYLSHRAPPCGRGLRHMNIRYNSLDTIKYQYTQNSKGLNDTLYFINCNGEKEAIIYCQYEYYK